MNILEHIAWWIVMLALGLEVAVVVNYYLF